MEMKVMDRQSNHREYTLPTIEAAFIFALYVICKGSAEVVSKPGRVDFKKDGELVAAMFPVYPGVSSNSPDSMMNWFLGVLKKAKLSKEQKAIIIRLCVPNIRAGRYWRGNVSEVLVNTFGRTPFMDCDLFL